jgi:hypothetical protein
MWNPDVAIVDVILDHLFDWIRVVIRDPKDGLLRDKFA